MDNNELINLYLEKLRILSLECLSEKETLTAMEALKQALIRLEGEMTGY